MLGGSQVVKLEPIADHKILVVQFFEL